MSKSFLKPEGVPHNRSIIRSVCVRRRVISVLSLTPYAVSLALIREEGIVQKPVYYTSQALKGVEGRYPQIEKLDFMLITASRKLRYYFQAHVINIMMDHPLKKAMNKLEVAGRLI